MHVTEVESFVTTARRAGAALTDADVDAYYDEQRRVAALMGLDPSTVPGSAAEVEAYYESVRPSLRMTKEAAETMVFLTAPPVPWKVSLPWKLTLELGPPRLVYFGIATTALGLLPPWARRLYGGLGLRAADMTAGLSARAIRLALAAVPRRYIEGPLYQAAMARAAAAEAAESKAAAVGAGAIAGAVPVRREGRRLTRPHGVATPQSSRRKPTLTATRKWPDPAVRRRATRDAPPTCGPVREAPQRGAGARDRAAEAARAAPASGRRAR